MIYLIDGYNLMHAAGLMQTRFGPSGLEKARRALVGVLAASLGDESTGTTVIFDAPAGGESSQLDPSGTHGICVEFAAGDEGADGRIEQLIHRAATPKKLTVVSSDARIRSAAKRRGVRAIDSDSFWTQLCQRRRLAKRPSENAKSDKPGARATREFWIEEFEGLISPDDLRELAGPFSDED